jgi:peptide/nickel transport system ATP-binding protein
VINPTEGCRFRWRCPYAIEKCSLVTPRPSPIGASEVACFVATGDVDDVTADAPRSGAATGR